MEPHKQVELELVGGVILGNRLWLEAGLTLMGEHVTGGGIITAW